jgi:hypothetical protein
MTDHFESIESTNRRTIMEIQKATRKPFPVEVVQVTLQNIEEVAVWCNGTIEQRATRLLGTTTDLPVIVIDSHSDRREAALGSWIVNLKGSFRTYNSSAFDSTFDILPAEKTVIDENKPFETVASGPYAGARVQLKDSDNNEGDLAIYDTGDDGTPDPETFLKIV